MTGTLRRAPLRRPPALFALSWRFGPVPTPCGEARYVGEAGYEGLEFRYYFCHVGDPAQLRGWISGGG